MQATRPTDSAWLRLALAAALCPLVACGGSGDSDGDDDMMMMPPPAGALFDGYGQSDPLSLPQLVTIDNFEPVDPEESITGFTIDPALP